MECNEIMETLRGLGNRKNVEGLKRFGIRSRKMLGVTMPEMRRLAKAAGKSHALALELWNTGYLEGRILASLVDEPGLVSEEQMDAWVSDFDSWAVCDQVCGNLFFFTDHFYKKILEWTGREEEFVRRAGFVLIAVAAWHAKDWPDEKFEAFFPLLLKYCTDERNFVKKAVNWALRNIGKRNPAMNAASVRAAETMAGMESRTARWIGKDALRELRDPSVLARIRGRDKKRTKG